MDHFGFPKRVDVSDELRGIVLELMINCMLEQPEDLAKFGLEFFTKMVEKRRTTRVEDFAKLEEVFSEYDNTDECLEDMHLQALERDRDLGEYYGEGDEWESDWRRLEVAHGEYDEVKTPSAGSEDTPEQRTSVPKKLSVASGSRASTAASTLTEATSEGPRLSTTKKTSLAGTDNPEMEGTPIDLSKVSKTSSFTTPSTSMLAKKSTSNNVETTNTGGIKSISDTKASPSKQSATKENAQEA